MNSLGQLQILSPIYRQQCLSTERIRTETWLLFSCVQLFVTPWTGVHQAPLSCTISWSLLKFMSIELVMLSNHVILCHPPLLLPSVFPSIRVFSNESALNIQWPKYWSFASTTVLPVNIWGWFPSGIMGSLGGSVVKNPPANGGDAGLIPGLGSSPGERNGNLLQYSCLGNLMDKRAWRAILHRVAKIWTWLGS